MTVVISSRLGEIAEAAIPKAQSVVNKTAYDIQGGAMQRARVDTGAMRSGIYIGPAGPLHARVLAQIDYTAYNEFGTRYKAAQPMFVPAAHEAEAPFIAAMKKVFS
jgi:hypothetical protein